MAWAAAVEAFGGGLVHDRLLAVWSEPWAPVRKLWGTTPEARQGQRAMMDLAGGPAPARATTARPTA